MTELIILSILIPFVTATILLFSLRNIRFQRITGITGSVFTLVISILLFRNILTHHVQVIHIGNWEAPVGITLYCDLLSSAMILISALLGLLTLIFSLPLIEKEREEKGFHSLIQFLIMGVNGCFLSGDIFNLFVWFELIMITSFVLITLGGEKQQLEGAIKYVTLNLVSTIFLLTAIAIIYGVTNSLNLAEIALKLPQIANIGIVNTISLLLILSFGIKAAVFPLYFWLPASYHTPPIYISAIFSGLLTKVGVYAIFRIFPLIFPGSIFSNEILNYIAISTMLIGGMGAIIQKDIRRILSFHIISQIGYMILGFTISTAAGIASGIVFMIHNMINKYNLFLISGAIFKIKGSYHIENIGGIGKKHPWLLLTFLVPSLSLAGIPPFSGFFAKLFLIKSAITEEFYFSAAIMLFVGIMTLYSMIKILNEAFWKKAPGEDLQKVESGIQFNSIILFSPIILLSTLSLLLGMYSEQLYLLLQLPSKEILNPAFYIQRVLE